MPQRVSFTEHIAKNLAHLALSLLALPITTILLLASYIHRPPAPPVSPRRKTLLLTNLSMTKSLHLARTFSTAGHRIITLDPPGALPTPGRLSRHISRSYTLPRTTVTPEQYAAHVLSLALSERVDIFLPCSSVQHPSRDPLAAETLTRETNITCIVPPAAATATLHDKSAFIAAAREAGLRVPDTVMCTSREEALSALRGRGGEGREHIMKSVALDDASRADMTRASAGYIAGLDVSVRRPWVLQEFIGGGREYASHAVVRRGKVRGFVGVRSCEMLMRYRALGRGDMVGAQMRGFTERMVDALGIGEGQVSFDFLVEEGGGVVGIECNPRTHTAVVVMRPEEIVGSVIDGDTPTTKGEEDGREVVWIGHELVTDPLGLVRRWGTWRDAVWDWGDMLPFWWMYAVWWPLVFIESLVEGERWSRVNISTGRVFRSC